MTKQTVKNLQEDAIRRFMENNRLFDELLKGEERTGQRNQYKRNDLNWEKEYIMGQIKAYDLILDLWDR